MTWIPDVLGRVVNYGRRFITRSHRLLLAHSEFGVLNANSIEESSSANKSPVRTGTPSGRDGCGVQGQEPLLVAVNGVALVPYVTTVTLPVTDGLVDKVIIG